MSATNLIITALIIIMLATTFGFLAILSRNSENSKIQECKVNLWMLGMAEKEYYQSHKSYTYRIDDLNIPINHTKCPTNFMQYSIKVDGNCFNIYCPRHGSVGCGD